MTDPELVLDQTVLEALRELGGEDEPELFEELVTMFLDDTPARLAEIMQAFENGDAHGLERSAHALKSSCGNLGAKRLAKLCFDIESAGRAGDLEAARSLVGRSNEEFDAVSTALRAELS